MPRQTRGGVRLGAHRQRQRGDGAVGADPRALAEHGSLSRPVPGRARARPRAVPAQVLAPRLLARLVGRLLAEVGLGRVGGCGSRGGEELGKAWGQQSRANIIAFESTRGFGKGGKRVTSRPHHKSVSPHNSYVRLDNDSRHAEPLFPRSMPSERPGTCSKPGSGGRTTVRNARGPPNGGNGSAGCG